ncbi:hypothetical protein C8R26_101100 [Nitrosomonas oligotropha]|uniref:Uncharacterized protein n=1 Tax=Nitrosomonas oligotropha TaxID=42354 RepID=A0A2T5I4N4_9PROT|nr:hypothetical protein [Nitrosomonas oligotropha]PTQ78785.1 hypothetical protein C8R26_101100 [Nitrosomonas oligotropha]
MGAYRLLVNVTVEHAYFSGQHCKTLEFIPSESCAVLLRRAGLLLKSSESGIAVYFDEEKINILRLHAEDDLVLTFKVFSKDNNFFRYTAPGAPPDDSILFFDTQQVTRDAADKQLLHLDAYAAADAWLKLTADPLPAILERKDYLVKPVFIVRVCITAGAEGLCSDKLDDAARKFYIRFTTNQTYWKYYILGDLSKRNVFIADLDNALQFENLGNVTLPGNRNAIQLLSSKAIPLHELPDQRLQLKESTGTGDRVLVKRLPNASVEQVHAEMISDKIASVSEIYIN